MFEFLAPFFGEESLSFEELKAQLNENPVDLAMAGLVSLDDYRALEEKFFQSQGFNETLKLDHAVEGAIAALRPKKAGVVKALLDFEGISLDASGLQGASEQLERIKTENPFLFEEERARPAFGRAAPGPVKSRADGGGKGRANKAIRDLMHSS